LPRPAPARLRRERGGRARRLRRGRAQAGVAARPGAGDPGPAGGADGLGFPRRRTARPDRVPPAAVRRGRQSAPLSRTARDRRPGPRRRAPALAGRGGRRTPGELEERPRRLTRHRAAAAPDAPTGPVVRVTTWPPAVPTGRD